MTDNRPNDEASHGSGQGIDRQAMDRGHRPEKNGEDTPRGAGTGKRHYIDPAEEAMSRNHNLSPAIHPTRD